MPVDRRYTEEEIATIFEHAASAQRAAQDHPSAGAGLTLDELQAIGSEAGISPEFVQRAASDLDADMPPPAQETFLGIPTSASHAVEIPGPFTNEAWDRLVVDLRQTFKARGEITIDGSIREWRNGNLFACMEPTDSGVRLRLGTRKVETRYTILAGIGWFAFMILVGLMKFAQNEFAFNYKVLFILILSLGGLGLSGYSAAWLRDWAGTRKVQMKAVAERALKAEDVRRRALSEPINTNQKSSQSTLLDMPDDESGGEEDRAKESCVRE